MKTKIPVTLKSALQSLLVMLFILMTGVTAVCAQTGWRKADALFEAMELKEGSWVADIGSREGYYTVRMSPIVGETGHIFAVDISEEALERLHKNIRKRELTNVTPVYSVSESPMLPANSLDAALVRNAYHEFINYMDMLRQIKKALKPGGLLVLADPISEDNKEASRHEQTDDHQLAIHFARDELKKAGFAIIEEVEEFSEVKRGRQYWMIIATPDN